MKLTVLKEEHKIIMEDLTTDEKMIISTALSCNRCESGSNTVSDFYNILWERKTVLTEEMARQLLFGLDNLTCDCHQGWEVVEGTYEYGKGEDRSMFYDDDTLNMISNVSHDIYGDLEKCFDELFKGGNVK